MNEVWKDIKGYEGLYQISNLGKVKSFPKIVGRRLKPETILKHKITVSQYPFVALHKNSDRIYKTIHRLVAEHFIPNPLKYNQINHIDGDRSNYKLENLEWCNQSHNMNHAYYTLGNKCLKNRPVLQFDLSGKFIARFESISIAAKSNNFKARNCIFNALRTETKISKGFKWQYE